MGVELDLRRNGSTKALPYERSSAVVNLSIVGVDVPGDPIKVGFAPKRTAREVGPYKRIIENNSQKVLSFSWKFFCLLFFQEK